MRLRAYVVTLVLVGLVASPLFGAFGGDSFPISTYPMFATARSTEVRVSHAVMLDAAGVERTVPPSAIANDEVLQAQETVRQALEGGDAATLALCDRIAARMVGSGAIEIQIVTSTFDAVGYTQGEEEPVARHVHAMCEVRQ